jgi:predicted Zn-dependent protease
MSEQQEIQIGRESDAEVRRQMGLYDDAGLQRYVADVGLRLAGAAHRPSLPWTFAVVDESAVNAFALPGGFIYLTRGILPFLRDEAELAAVLAHEVGHVDARHSAEQYSQQTLAGGGLAILGVLVPETRPAQDLAGIGLGAIFLKFGRDDELEADRLGVGYAAGNGWDPDGMPGLLGTLARLDQASGSRRGIPNWALTHPPAADRVVRVQEAVKAAPAATTTNAAEFERRLDGLVFGDSREKGIVRGSQFLHPVLRFAIRFPEGWEITNSDEQVLARQGESNTAMLLQLGAGSGPLDQVAAASMQKNGWRLVSGDGTRINGLDAYVGTYQGTMNNTPVTIRAAHVRSGEQLYIVAGVAPSADFGRASSTFTSAIQTFRALSRAEADAVQPARIDFHVVRPGETWESIARRSGSGSIGPGTLAIMNGSDAPTPPQVGRRIRVVVGG